MTQEKLFFLYDKNNEKSTRAYKLLTKRYRSAFTPSIKDCDYVIVLGGDGFMLRSLKQILSYKRKLTPQGRKNLHFKVYGLNYGHVGALLNPKNKISNLMENIACAETIQLSPLKAEIFKANKHQYRGYAFNEISIKSIVHQMCHLSIHIKAGSSWQNYNVKGDGLIVSTPAGSTAYYHHAGGAPFPLNSPLLGLQSICGAIPLQKIVPDSVRIVINASDIHRRPICAVMDNQAVNNIRKCQITLDRANAIPLLLNKKEAFRFSIPIKTNER